MSESRKGLAIRKLNEALASNRLMIPRIDTTPFQREMRRMSIIGMAMAGVSSSMFAQAKRAALMAPATSGWRCPDPERNLGIVTMTEPRREKRASYIRQQLAKREAAHTLTLYFGHEGDE